MSCGKTQPSTSFVHCFIALHFLELMTESIKIYFTLLCNGKRGLCFLLETQRGKNPINTIISFINYYHYWWSILVKCHSSSSCSWFSTSILSIDKQKTRKTQHLLTVNVVDDDLAWWTIWACCVWMVVVPYKTRKHVSYLDLVQDL